MALALGTHLDQSSVDQLDPLAFEDAFEHQLLVLGRGQPPTGRE